MLIVALSSSLRILPAVGFALPWVLLRVPGLWDDPGGVAMFCWCGEYCWWLNGLVLEVCVYFSSLFLHVADHGKIQEGSGP